MNDQAADRRAQALAEINKMQTDLNACHAEIATLRRDNDRSADRVDMLVEERNRYRSEATMYRTKLVELATSMANIGILTMQAQEIMMTVKEISAKETPEESAAEQASARSAVEGLPRTVSNGHRGGET